MSCCFFSLSYCLQYSMGVSLLRLFRQDLHIQLFWIGWVVSTLLAGATIGSFTGGALADKFGRTKTFQLDAIPLAVGAFLWSVSFALVLACVCHFFFQNFIYCRSLSQKVSNFQCHSLYCADNDSGPLPCWHWNWHCISYCAAVHIWGSNLSYLLAMFSSICLSPSPNILFYG